MNSIETLSKSSPKIIILRGAISMLFGVLALVFPGAALLTMAFAYGIYALFDGVLAIQMGVRLGKQHRPWGFSILEGILGVLAGIVTLFWPGITIFVLSVMVGVWALITGFFEVYEGFELSRARVGTGSKVFLILAGILSVALGVVILMRPALGTVTLVTLVATYALIFGALYIGLGIQVRRSQERLEEHGTITRIAS